MLHCRPLKALPADGFYAIPNPETPAGQAAFESGPTAFVHFRAAGRPVFDPLMLVKGIVHYFLIALLIGVALRGVPADARSRLALFLGLIAVGYIHIAGGIWWGYNWTTVLFFAVADFAIIAGGGLVMARFLRREA